MPPITSTASKNDPEPRLIPNSSAPATIHLIHWFLDEERWDKKPSAFPKHLNYVLILELYGAKKFDSGDDSVINVTQKKVGIGGDEIGNRCGRESKVLKALEFGFPRHWKSSNSHMEDHKEKNGSWMSVPQFGDWDQKGNMPDYSLDFSKIREMRKQNKRDLSRTSIGNDEELIPQRNNNNNNNDGGGRRKLVEEKLHPHSDHHHNHSPTVSSSLSLVLMVNTWLKLHWLI
ncbi:hypothetical protein GIB67_022610 [Kingdonia uniflora]|uniref:RIN4 pathogenic type III effector avirulence factor Avr cleavage site domain-containing protein n=1 Tax=Kingdonia uniflora TaxID=39325 RepID=A0A7J7P8U8_9MAGN|nr:hypothetical protein GIB67_022610 [Kingdonia uniflora]